jgi:hypothetical protein
VGGVKRVTTLPRMAAHVDLPDPASLATRGDDGYGYQCSI